MTTEPFDFTTRILGFAACFYYMMENRTEQQVNSNSILTQRLSNMSSLSHNTVEPHYFEVQGEMGKKFEIAGFRNTRPG